ncbi:MAG: hypothetical protein ACF8OB_05825 [Phycisphaeraceae bacterium JB051]
MTGILVFGIIAFLLALVVFVVRHERRESRKRAVWLADFAQRLGLAFEEQVAGKDSVAFSQAQVLCRGHGTGSIHNYMTGKRDGIDFVLADFRYYINTGRNSTLYKISLAAYHLPTLDMPAFSLMPKSVGSKIAAFFGAKQINFEQHPVFSKNYRLLGDDEQAIRQCFTPSLMAEIENRLLPKQYGFESCAEWLIVHSDASLVNVEDWQSFFDSSYTLVKRVTQLTQTQVS